MDEAGPEAAAATVFQLSQSDWLCQMGRALAQSYRDSDQHCDLFLRSTMPIGGGSRILAHSVVLCAISPWVRSYLQAAPRDPSGQAELLLHAVQFTDLLEFVQGIYRALGNSGSQLQGSPTIPVSPPLAAALGLGQNGAPLHKFAWSKPAPEGAKSPLVARGGQDGYAIKQENDDGFSLGEMENLELNMAWSDDEEARLSADNDAYDDFDEEEDDDEPVQEDSDAAAGPRKRGRPRKHDSAASGTPFKRPKLDAGGSQQQQQQQRHRVSCELCAFTSMSRAEMSAHVREKHDSERQFACGECEMDFVFLYELRKHEMLVHQTNVRDQRLKQGIMANAALPGKSKDADLQPGNEAIKESLKQAGYRLGPVIFVKPPYPEFKSLPHVIKGSRFRAILGIRQQQQPPDEAPGSIGERAWQSRVLAWSDPTDSELITQFEAVMPALRSVYGYSLMQTNKRGALVYRQGIRTGKRLAKVRENMLTSLRQEPRETLEQLLEEARARAEAAARCSRGRPRLELPATGSLLALEVDPSLAAERLESVWCACWFPSATVCFPLEDDSHEKDVAAEHAVKTVFDTWCTTSKRLRSEFLIAEYDAMLRISFGEEVIRKLLAPVPQKQCAECGEFLPYLTGNHRTLFRYHRQRHEHDRFQCDCKLSFKSPRAKRMHIQLHHSGGRYKQCGQCSFVGTDKQLENHAKEHRAFVCDLCGKTLPSLRHYQTHMKQHADWTCKICGETFKGWSKYHRHYTNRHTGTWQCDQCEVSFSNKRSLEIHQKNKHLPDREKPFPCDKCTKGFAEKCKLIRHLNTVHNKQQ